MPRSYRPPAAKPRLPDQPRHFHRASRRALRLPPPGAPTLCPVPTRGGAPSARTRYDLTASPQSSRAATRDGPGTSEPRPRRRARHHNTLPALTNPHSLPLSSPRTTSLASKNRSSNRHAAKSYKTKNGRACRRGSPGSIWRTCSSTCSPSWSRCARTFPCGEPKVMVRGRGSGGTGESSRQGEAAYVTEGRVSGGQGRGAALQSTRPVGSMADQVRSDRNADGEIVEMSTGMGIIAWVSSIAGLVSLCPSDTRIRSDARRS